jgi:hypothetical protein
MLECQYKECVILFWYSLCYSDFLFIIFLSVKPGRTQE